MNPLDSRIAALRSDRGFTLIELLVSMLIGLVVSLAAFAMLEFTTSDVSRITSRAHVDQTGRVALEKIMLQLHSACVAVSVTPIHEGSNAENIKFISETSPLNGQSEPVPVSSLSTVRLHEIVYNSTERTLTEKSYLNTGPETAAGNYPFAKTASSTTKLLTGVKQTENSKKEFIPIFQYYRYYEKGDKGPKGETEPPYGELNPNALTGAGTPKELTETEAESVAKVTVSFTLAPEGHESIIAKGGQPIALEDSASFRLASPSEASTKPNGPCAELT
jgi:prepilin-type N-terminal cleavage/methylation domain-containing protein